VGCVLAQQAWVLGRGGSMADIGVGRCAVTGPGDRGGTGKMLGGEVSKRGMRGGGRQYLDSVWAFLKTG
jgi:hypothetical protein